MRLSVSDDLLVEYERNGETFQEWVTVDEALHAKEIYDKVREITPTQDQIDNRRNAAWKVEKNRHGIKRGKLNVVIADKPTITETSQIVHFTTRITEMKNSTIFDITNDLTGEHIASFDCKTSDEADVSHMRLAIIRMLSKFGVRALIKQD